MQIVKLHAPADGLIPAGTYFARLSRALEDQHTRATSRQHALDAEDRALEARYRRASATRGAGVMAS